MLGDDHETRVVPSVLDRLVDREPGSREDTTPTQERRVREFRRQVARDLECLLNARNSVFDVADAFPEVGQSVIAFGLPDYSAKSLARDVDREAIRQGVLAAIAAFEPRLSGVTVSPLSEKNDKSGARESDRSKSRSLRLHVEAQLAIGSARHPVSFEIDFSLLAGRCDFKDRG